jgi:hypothetical protein
MHSDTLIDLRRWLTLTVVEIHGQAVRIWDWRRGNNQSGESDRSGRILSQTWGSAA